MRCLGESKLSRVFLVSLESPFTSGSVSPIDFFVVYRRRYNVMEHLTQCFAQEIAQPTLFLHRPAYVLSEVRNTDTHNRPETHRSSTRLTLTILNKIYQTRSLALRAEQFEEGSRDVVRSFPFPVQSVCCVKASEAAQVSFVYVIGGRQHDPEMTVFLTDGQGFWTVLDGLYSLQSAVNECRMGKDLASHDHDGVDIISVERQDGFEV